MQDQHSPDPRGPSAKRERDPLSMEGDLSDDPHAADIPEVWRDDPEDDGHADPEHARRLAAVRTELLHRSYPKPTSGE